MKIFFTILAGGVSISLLDFLVIGNLLKSFYIEKMGFHLNLLNGAVNPNIKYAVITYIVMSFAAYFFAVRDASNWCNAAMLGALLGFCVYATYDFTNLSIMKNYPLSLALVDTAWGTILMGIVSAIMFLILG